MRGSAALGMRLLAYRETLLSNNDNADLAGALTSAVVIDEEDAGQAIHLKLAVLDLKRLVTADDGGAKVSIAVPEHGAIAPGR